MFTLDDFKRRLLQTLPVYGCTIISAIVALMLLHAASPELGEAAQRKIEIVHKAIFGY